MKKKCIFIVILFFLIVNTTGCWNYIELDERAIVVAVGIDKADKEGEIMVTVQLLKPGELGTTTVKGGDSGGKEKTVWVISSTGKTIFEAIRDFTMESDRKLYFQQNRLVVFSEEIAREGVLPIMDMFIRDPEMRSRTKILVCKGKASEVLKGESELENIPASGIEKLIENRVATSKTSEINMHEFMVKLASKTTSPIATKIELLNENNKDEPPGIKVSGSAAFKEDKFVGWLDRTETRGLLWIINEITSGIIVVESPSNKNKHLSFEILKASSKIKPELRDGKVIIVIDIEEEGTLGEQEVSTDLSTQDMLKDLEELKADAIEKEIRTCLVKAQKELKSDIFGFGEKIYRSLPKEWKNLEKNWDKEFPDIVVEINVTAKIIRTNIILAPIGAE